MSREFSMSDLDLTESLSASMLIGISSIMIDSLRKSLPLDIHTAASLGSYDAVKTRIAEDSGCVRNQNWKGWSPLHYASYMGHDTIVNLLLEHNADVSATCTEGLTPLHYACANGRESVAYFLIQNGSDVNAKADDGITPLLSAAMNGEISTLKVLLQSGAHVECCQQSTGNTPLLAATQQGSESCVKALLDVGCNIGHRNKKNKTCRDIAMSQKHANMTIINLLNARARPTQTPKRAEAALNDAPLLGSPPMSPTVHRLHSPLSLQREPSASKDPEPTTVLDFLKRLQLEKFYPIFQKQEVDFEVLKTMTEPDLKAIGITLFGPRRKLAMAIESLRQRPVTLHPTPHRPNGLGPLSRSPSNYPKSSAEQRPESSPSTTQSFSQRMPQGISRQRPKSFNVMQRTHHPHPQAQPQQWQPTMSDRDAFKPAPSDSHRKTPPVGSSFPYPPPARSPAAPLPPPDVSQLLLARSSSSGSNLDRSSGSNSNSGRKPGFYTASPSSSLNGIRTPHFSTKTNLLAPPPVTSSPATPTQRALDQYPSSDGSGKERRTLGDMLSTSGHLRQGLGDGITNPQRQPGRLRTGSSNSNSSPATPTSTPPTSAGLRRSQRASSVEHKPHKHGSVKHTKASMKIVTGKRLIKKPGSESGQGTS